MNICANNLSQHQEAKEFFYFDHNATTEIHPGIFEEMLNLSKLPLNASSIHSYGRKAYGILEEARAKILSIVGVGKDDKFEVIFLSSGTEANNLIINNFIGSKILISAIEHPSIYKHKEFYDEIEIIKVDKNGVVDLEDLERLLILNQGNIGLISVMCANNETGVIQPISEIVTMARKHQIYVHSDITQCVGKMPINLVDLGLDFATISAHKFGGPQGAAALIRKKNTPLKANLIGGGQERGLRAGTENIINIYGFGRSCDYVKDMLTNCFKLEAMRNRLEDSLKEFCKEMVVFGKEVTRLPNTSLLTMPGVESKIQLMNFDVEKIAVSSGSACSSGKIESSHVLKSMNVDETIASCALRVSLGYRQKITDIDYLIYTWKKIYLRLRGKNVKNK